LDLHTPPTSSADSKIVLLIPTLLRFVATYSPATPPPIIATFLIALVEKLKHLTKGFKTFIFDAIFNIKLKLFY